MGLFIRRRSPDSEQLVAAQTVNIAIPGAIGRLQQAKMLGRVHRKRAWEWFGKIGEVHYAVTRAGKIAGFADFQLAEDKATGGQKRVKPSDKAAAPLGDIWSPMGGLPRLISQFVTLMKIDGQCHLVRNKDDDGSFLGYDFVSDDELDFTEDRIRRLMFPAVSGMSGSGGDSFLRDIAPED